MNWEEELVMQRQAERDKAWRTFLDERDELCKRYPDRKRHGRELCAAMAGGKLILNKGMGAWRRWVWM